MVVDFVTQNQGITTLWLQINKTLEYSWCHERRLAPPDDIIFLVIVVSYVWRVIAKYNVHVVNSETGTVGQWDSTAAIIYGQWESKTAGQYNSGTVRQWNSKIGTVWQ